jgi:hypothetical protein
MIVFIKSPSSVSDIEYISSLVDGIWISILWDGSAAIAASLLAIRLVGLLADLLVDRLVDLLVFLVIFFLIGFTASLAVLFLVNRFSIALIPGSWSARSDWFFRNLPSKIVGSLN